MQQNRFETSVSEVIPDLQRQAERLTRSSSDADDLLQDSILRAWRFRERFEEGTNLKAWLRRIVFNTFISEKRRYRRELQRIDAVRQECEDAERMAESRTLAEGRDSRCDEVMSALAKLPENYRHVVELIDIEQKSYREAAEELGCPIGTVMSRLNRARQALRSKLHVDGELIARSS